MLLWLLQVLVCLVFFFSCDLSLPYVRRSATSSKKTRSSPARLSEFSALLPPSKCLFFSPSLPTNRGLSLPFTHVRAHTAVACISAYLLYGVLNACCFILTYADGVSQDQDTRYELLTIPPQSTTNQRGPENIFVRSASGVCTKPVQRLQPCAESQHLKESRESLHLPRVRVHTHAYVYRERRVHTPPRVVYICRFVFVSACVCGRWLWSISEILCQVPRERRCLLRATSKEGCISLVFGYPTLQKIQTPAKQRTVRTLPSSFSKTD